MNTPLRSTESAGYMTNWAARLFARAIDARLRGTGVSSGQMPVFFALGNGGALSQTALVEAAEIEQPTMAATLARMERDGLVSRRTDPNDRRAALYALTPQALTLLPQVRDAIEAVNSAALSGMSKEEQEAYLALVARAVDGLRASAQAED